MQLARFFTYGLCVAILGLAVTPVHAKETARRNSEQSKHKREISDLSSLKVTLRSFFPSETIQVARVNKAIALSGIVSNADVARKAVEVAKEFSREPVLNFMQVKSSQQVMLRVRVGEIQRSALKQLGANIAGVRRTSNVTVPFSTGGGIGSNVGNLVSPAGTFGTAGVIYRATNGKLDLSASIDALEEQGLMKILAEPNLVAVSGEAAEFLAGGEFPVPTSREHDEVTVEYKPFGVQVGFTPTVLSSNRIRLTVQPEVSDLTTDQEAGAIVAKGFRIPAVTSRRAKTTVELAPGESFMIAGLIRDDMRNKISQFPGLGDIPILSALFRSSAFQRNETELVIAVTPYLVDPVSGTEVKLPTDNFQAPSTLDTLFFGALSARSTTQLNGSSGLEGPSGYIAE